jgi:hypothetical protein
VDFMGSLLLSTLVRMIVSHKGDVRFQEHDDAEGLSLGSLICSREEVPGYHRRQMDMTWKAKIDVCCAIKVSASRLDLCNEDVESRCLGR